MDEIKLYENKQIRSVWDDEKEEWYFSVVDVVGVLTESENPQIFKFYRRVEWVLRMFLLQ